MSSEDRIKELEAESEARHELIRRLTSRCEELQNKANIPKDTLAWLMRRLNPKDMAELMLSISTGQPIRGK